MREDPPPKHRIFVGTAGSVNVPSICRHCGNAPCIAACPTGAIARKGPDEPVLLDESLCIGCRACIAVCPFGVIAPDSRGRLVVKCDLCAALLEKGKDPACVSACPTAAIRFMTPEEAAEERRKAAAATETEAGGGSATSAKGLK
ncbi:MAG: 4Fe-4S binding protein [Planctomycetota bacterium]|nr:4Fe-4S binding protein [Planctomycetota bacterium]